MGKLYESEIPIFFTPPRTKIDKCLYMDAPDPPQADPRMFTIMNDQIGLSKEALQFAKQAYDENKTRQAALDQMNLKIGDGLIKDAETNRQRSADAYEFYKTHGRPLQEQIIEDAKDYDSEANIGAFRGRAAGDVEQAFGQVEAQNARSLSRLGVMPNANRLAALTNSLAIQKAAAKAGAMNNADQGVRDRAYAMRANAANVAAGLPAQAIQFGAAGQNAGQAAMGNQLNVNNQNMQTQQGLQAGFSNAGSLMGGAASTGASINDHAMRAWQGQVSQANAGNAGLGSLAGAAIGFFADGGMVGGNSNADGSGGKIVGPGNGVSDSIAAINTTTGQPVRVSNGEFIIPADVVRRKGTEFFERLIQKDHKPAALQRKHGRA